jgi:hypothetical protein
MDKFFRMVSWLVLVAGIVVAAAVYTGKLQLKGTTFGVANTNVLYAKIALVIVILFLLNRLGAVIKFVTAVGLLLVLGYIALHLQWVVK